MKGAKLILSVIVVILIIARIGMRLSRLNRSKPNYEKTEAMFDHSQRENVQINKFTDTTAKVKKITGWYLDQNIGKWINKPNRIASGSETGEETSLNWL